MIEKTSNTISGINLGFSQKKAKIKIKNPNKFVLNFFFKNNLVSNLYIKNNIYYLLLNLKNNIEIKNFFRKNSKLYFTKNQLIKKKMNLFSTVYVLSTNKGIVTQYEALKLNCGGFLIAKIFIK